ncbi:MAG: translation initiation factor IF-2 [Alphaproteobacteria bacterium]
MTEGTDDKTKKPLSLGGRGRLQLNRQVETGQVRQSFSHGRSKTVAVEVKRKRAVERPPVEVAKTSRPKGQRGGQTGAADLTETERESRVRALKQAIQAHEEAKVRQAEEEERRRIEAEERRKAEAEEAKRRVEDEARRKAEAEAEAATSAAQPAPAEPAAAVPPVAADQARRPHAAHAPAREPAEATAEPEEERRAVAGKRAPVRARSEPRRRTGKLTIAQALDGSAEDRQRSLAAVRRAREKEKQRLSQQQRASEKTKVIRDVVVPEVITVQELANRMAERAADVIKTLMRSGVMATINHALDADTAELVVTEFGHRARRVTEADVEQGLELTAEHDSSGEPRPPVVTVMGHVDHGKTSLLDALRKSDVVSREAGGITQHIGAYQVTTDDGHKITFLDTPGHAAFTAMRARGAKVTDLVVLVVAADDSIQPQTVEAIRHAKAAGVPMIVAINKIDRPDANPDKVRTDLLAHEIQVEALGGDVLDVPVSALKGTNLDRLVEAILLQAELLDLRANATGPAQGAIIESRMERGRGSVATALIQRGTLRPGDIFIAGAEWGRVRALVNDRGEQVEAAGPSMPVSILGLQGTPEAGDDVIVVDSESRAREVAEFRSRRKRDQDSTPQARGTLEQMFSAIKSGESKELAIVLKADVHGSVEAIAAALEQLANEEVGVRVLHAAVGGINESDITLAKASGALVVGFNVRANPQARDMAQRDGVDIRYYSVIYDIVNDAKALIQGLMAPTLQENFLGHAEIREVFTVTKAGKVAGCRVTDGVVRRGSKVRLLRDDVVIHEGNLGTLRRFKDEVREVQAGYECGMGFENYQDIQVGDVIECFEVQEVAAKL